jgi:hypothetical protein
MDLTVLGGHDSVMVLRLLKRELFCLATFPDNWRHESNPNLTKVKMASVGFFYTGFHDRVQCAFCKVFIEDWGPLDTPAGEHRRHTLQAPGERYIFCPLMADFPTGNVCRDAVTGREITWSRDIATLNSLLNNLPDNNNAKVLPDDLILVRETTLADIIRTQRPKKPSMKIQTKREETFTDWPIVLRHSMNIKVMAHAGFYCTCKN